jgi:hypothetical protein
LLKIACIGKKRENLRKRPGNQLCPFENVSPRHCPLPFRPGSGYLPSSDIDRHITNFYPQQAQSCSDDINIPPYRRARRQAKNARRKVALELPILGAGENPLSHLDRCPLGEHRHRVPEAAPDDWLSKQE